LVEKGVVERSHLCGFGDALAEYFDFEVSMGSVQRYRHGRQLRRFVLSMVHGSGRSGSVEGNAKEVGTEAGKQLGVLGLKLWPLPGLVRESSVVVSSSTFQSFSLSLLRAKWL